MHTGQLSSTVILSEVQLSFDIGVHSERPLFFILLNKGKNLTEQVASNLNGNLFFFF